MMHTPGDWQADFDVEPGRDIPIRVHLPCINGLSAWFEIGKAFAFDESEAGYTDGALNEAATVANARLFASAATLLIAVKAARMSLKACGYADNSIIIEGIDAAIAKAEGRK